MNQISSLPEGNLYCKKNGKFIQWIKSNHSSPIYIKKSDREYASKLALRKFLTTELSGLLLEKKLLEDYELLHQRNTQEKNFYLKENPGYKELLQPVIPEHFEDFYNWANTAYEGNPYKPEQKRFETLDGHFVRSKSESIIADALYELNIPYRYESPMIIIDHTIYPDFTIVKPDNGDKVVWEHFGMMDSNSYRDSAASKISNYIRLGYVPGINFIATYETMEHPLTSYFVHDTIQQYLL